MVLITNAPVYDFIAFIIVALVGFITFAKWKYSYLAKKGLYTRPAKIPFGNGSDAVTLKKSFGELFSEFYKDIRSKNLKHAGAYIFFKPFYIPADLEIVKAIMQTDFSHFMNHGAYMNEKGDPLSAHIFSLEDDRWKNLRIKLTPTFTSGKMKMMFNTLAQCSVELNNLLNDYSKTQEPLDIKDILQRFTMDIIGSCAFGIDCNGIKDPNSEFVKKGQLLFETNFKNASRNILGFTLPHPLLHFFNVKAFDEESTSFFMEVLKKMVKYRETNNVYRKDFMHLLLQLKNRGKVFDDDKLTDDNEQVGDCLTFNELAAQAFVFFIAGYETSSTAMTFALFELAQRPDLQKKMRDEIHTVLSKHDGKLTYDAIKDMTYMEQVLNESLRKYPPVSVLIRKCNKEYTIPGTGVVLEKGDNVAIPVMGIHRDPEIYPNPDEFDPDRFNEENKTRHQFAWIPFGEGPRVCIGLRFGVMQAKVGLTTILKDYDLSLSSKTSVPLEINPKSFILVAKGGVWINVKKRV